MGKHRWLYRGGILAGVCAVLGAAVGLGLHGGKAPLFPDLTAEDVAGWNSYDEPLTQTAATVGAAEKIAENGGSALYFNGKTCELKVVREDGTVWYSNPQNRLDYGSGHVEAYSSQLYVDVITDAEVAKTLYSYSECVQYGQFETQRIPDGIRVAYGFGKVKKVKLYPQALTVERFDEIADRLDAEGRKYLKTYYTLLDVSQMTDAKMLETLRATYTMADELGRLYICKGTMSAIEEKRVLACFGQVDYTLANRRADHEKTGFAEETAFNNNFLIPVEYTLKNGRLRARIDGDGMKTAGNVKIVGVTLLPHLNTAEGARDTTLLLPDGSGALVRLGTVRSAGTSSYSEPVYGRDYAVMENARLSEKPGVAFPFYGLYNGEGGYTAAVVEGAAGASVTAAPRTTASPLGYAAFRFKMLDYASVKLLATDTETVRSYPDTTSAAAAEVEFRFLDKSRASWMGLAMAYREDLKAAGKLPAAAGAGVPVMLRLLGAADDVKPLLGFPREILVPLTTYEEAGTILSELRAALPDARLAVQYSGWMRGGLKSGLADRVRTESALGGGSGWRDLLQAARGADAGLFPDADFQYVYRDRAFDGFRTDRDAAQLVVRETACKYTFNPSNFLADTDRLYGYVLNPRVSLKTARAYLPEARKAGLDGMAIPFVGSELNGDFKSGSRTTRQQAEELTATMLRECAEGGLRVMTAGANLYTLPYVSYVADVPLSAGNHPFLDESVPFTQVVLSGSVAYGAEDFAEAGDVKRYVLQCIETGSALYTTAMYRDSAVLKGTKYDGYAVVTTAARWDEMTAAAAEIVRALAPVAGRQIIGHDRLEGGLVRVDYDNGQRLYVNYAHADAVTPEGETVAAESTMNTTWR